MGNELTIQLTGELRRFVEERVHEGNVFHTPNEYINDLIRQDMEEKKIVEDVLQGLREARNGEFVPESIIDILHM